MLFEVSCLLIFIVIGLAMLLLAASSAISCACLLACKTASVSVQGAAQLCRLLATTDAKYLWLCVGLCLLTVSNRKLKEKFQKSI